MRFTTHLTNSYTINVGRFHPFDKAIQFFGDTAPFLLLGVNAEVFAAYFVLYAINGFYQHSNADVRLGFLNYLIAGPELHGGIIPQKSPKQMRTTGTI